MPMINKTRFVIAVPDLKLSSAFYRDVLGFTIHTLPDPRFLIYTCGNCTIFAGECPGAISPFELGDHSYFAYLEVSDIDTFYKSLEAARAKICKPICTEPWGMREFGVVTADGHRIMFASPVS